jgi:hypothetical protein
MDEETTVQKVTTVSQEAPVQVVKTTKTVTPPPVQTEHPQKVYEKKKAIFRTYQVIWYILGVIEVLLVFRVILKMLGASPLSGFTILIYTLSDPFALPFYGIFKISRVEGSVFEWSTFVAGTVYLIIAYGITALMQVIKPTTPEEVESSV